MVETSVLREAVDRSGLSLYELAARIGWFDYRGRPDQARVSRVLGVIAYQNGNGRRTYRRKTSDENGCKIAHALGLNPQDVGL